MGSLTGLVTVTNGLDLAKGKEVNPQKMYWNFTPASQK